MQILFIYFGFLFTMQDQLKVPPSFCGFINYYDLIIKYIGIIDFCGQHVSQD